MDGRKWFIKGSTLRSDKIMLRSDLCNYSNAYIIVKWTITVEGTDDANTKNKNLTFKNNAPFRSCKSKINNTFIENAEDHRIVMPMYNLLENSDNYSMISGRLGNYHRDAVNDDAKEIITRVIIG